MKTLIVILLTFASHFSFAENTIIVCGSIVSPQKIKLKIFEPINGYYNMSFFDNGKSNFIINQSDSFYFKSAISSPVTLLLYITTEDDNFITKSVLVMFPQDSLHLTIDIVTESKESIKYDGSNANGHKLFNDLDYNPVFKYQNIIDILNREDQEPKSFIQEVDKSLLALTIQFDDLLSQSKISQAFSDYNKIVFRQLIYQFIIGKFLNDYKKREMFTSAERNMIIDSFFTKQPVSDAYTKSTYNSFIYMILYYDYLSYKKLAVSTIGDLSKVDTFLIKGKHYIIDNECGQFFHIEDRIMREDLWANFMVNLMNKYPAGKFDETILQFNEIFPNSTWNAVLKRHSNSMKHLKVAEYFLQFPVQYIDTSNNTSLQNLLQKLPEHKAIFIDLWASWCGPCLKAFEYNAYLDTFLLNNNIERMYISLDKNEEQWRSAINAYALGGNHYLMNDLLLQDIKRICGIKDNEPMAIPRYLLVSKDKKILLNNAISPANTSLLKQQIREYLLQ